MQLYQHVVTGSKPTNQTMNRMILLYFCVYEKDTGMTFQLQNLINICYCIVVGKTKIRRDQDQWRSQWGGKGGGQSATPDSENLPKIGKKSGKKR